MTRTSVSAGIEFSLFFFFRFFIFYSVDMIKIVMETNY